MCSIPANPRSDVRPLRARRGIPIDPGLWTEFADWSTRLGVQLPEPQ